MELLGFRYALHGRMRFALTAAGVAGAVTLTVFLAGVYRGATRGSLSYVEHAGADVWVGRKGSWNLMRVSGLLPEGVAGRVIRIDGVREAEPILAALLPATVHREPRTLLVIGLEEGAKTATPRFLADGEALPSPGEVVVDQAFARRAGLGIGDSLRLSDHAFRIAGISRETNLLVTQYAFLSVEDLRSLLGLGRQSSFVLVRARAGCDPAALAARIAEKIPGLAAYDAPTFLENNRQEIAHGFLPVLWAIAVLGMVVGAMVVALMTYTAILERRTDYALLAAIGCGEGTRMLVVLEQAMAAAVAGGVTGLLFLSALQHLLPVLVPEVEFRLEGSLAAAAMLGALAMAILGALFPARLVSRITPMEVFRR